MAELARRISKWPRRPVVSIIRRCSLARNKARLSYATLYDRVRIGDDEIRHEDGPGPNGTRSVAAAAKALNVSPRNVKRATAIRKTDPAI
jgi:hypothetical protein